MDKRDLGEVFRARLASLVQRFDGNHARFAGSIGLDRSALSQLLSAESTRLPRAETLQRIAEAHNVSLDWLLGLSQSDRLATEIAPTLEIERSPEGSDDSQLASWHREASGYKIRYVPSSIPDILRTRDVIIYESARSTEVNLESKLQETERSLAYSRRPETDMEVCMPLQCLELLASGQGIWSGLSVQVRRDQLAHMVQLIEELYPTFRLFLYDGRSVFSAPYTVFGPLRSAIYLGEMYIVINSVEHIRALIRHFDDLIRKAVINPNDVASFIRGLMSRM